MSTEVATGKSYVSTQAVRYGRASTVEAKLHALVAAVESMGLSVDIDVAYAGDDWCATAEVSAAPRLTPLDGPVPKDAGTLTPVPLWRRGEVTAMRATGANMKQVAVWLSETLQRQAWVDGSGAVRMADYYGRSLSVWPGEWVVVCGDHAQTVSDIRSRFALLDGKALPRETSDQIQEWRDTREPVQVWCKDAFVGMRLTRENLAEAEKWMLNASAGTASPAISGLGIRFTAMATDNTDDEPVKVHAKVGDWVVRVGFRDFDLVEADRFKTDFGLVEVRDGSEFDRYEWRAATRPEWVAYRTPHVG